METHVSPRKKSIKDLFEGLKASRRKLKLRCDSLGKRIVLLMARVTLLVRKFVHLSLKTERLDSRITDLENAHTPVPAVTAVPPVAAAAPAPAESVSAPPDNRPSADEARGPSRHQLQEEKVDRFLLSLGKFALFAVVAGIVGFILYGLACLGSRYLNSALAKQSVVVVAGDAKPDEKNLQATAAFTANQVALVEALNRLNQEQEKKTWGDKSPPAASTVTNTTNVTTVINEQPSDDDSCDEDDSAPAEGSEDYAEECPRQTAHYYYLDQWEHFVPIDPTVSFGQPTMCYYFDSSGYFIPVDLTMSLGFGWSWWRDGRNNVWHLSNHVPHRHWGDGRTWHRNNAPLLDRSRGGRGNGYGDHRPDAGRRSPGYGRHRSGIGQSPSYGGHRPGTGYGNRGPGNSHGNRGSNSGHGNRGSGSGHGPGRH